MIMLISVTKAVREFTNQENHDFCLSSDLFSKFQFKAMQDLMEVADYRPYRKASYTLSLKTATRFMKNLKESPEIVWVNTVYRRGYVL